MTESDPGTEFLLRAGGAIGGGAAIGALAGFIGWLISQPLLGLYARLRGLPPSAVTTEGLGNFMLVGTAIGGLVGFTVWILEHYEVS